MSHGANTKGGAKDSMPDQLRLGDPGFFLLASWLCFGVALYSLSAPGELFVPFLGAGALSSLFCGTGLIVGLLRWRRESHSAQWLTVALLLWGLVLAALIVPAL